MKEILIFAGAVVGIKLYEHFFASDIEAQVRANPDPNFEPVPPTWPYIFPIAAAWVAFRVGEGKPILSLKSGTKSK